MTPETRLVIELLRSMDNGEQITLVLGSGIGAPRVADVLRLADQYAAGRGDGGDLSRALTQARGRVDAGSPNRLYAAYRQVFAAWVSGEEFDVIVQQAVLERYRPPDRMATPLATHGIWQRVARELGERLENDIGSWQLPRAMEALGATLVRQPGIFGNRVVTTNVDPLLEVAIRAASGRAVSVPLDGNGRHGRPPGYDSAIQVFHLHGFWRPVSGAGAATLVHDPTRFAAGPTIQSVAELINGDTVCVLGTSDWAGAITRALAAIARQRGIRVLWAVHGDVQEARRRRELLRGEGVDAECLPGADSEQLLALLARRLDVTVPPRTAGPPHSVRHPTWESELVSQPDSAPPDTIPRLLAQLERRFAWRFQPATTGSPDLVCWPVRLRRQASVIHMAQALVAGALAARGARLVVLLDDFGIWQPESVGAPFEADLRRWIRHTGSQAKPEFVSLSRFVEEQRRRLPSPEHLLRPVDPWAVARDFYGEHNPSLYSVLAAIKVVPNVALHEMEENAWPILQSLLRRNANRLLTPLTMWSFLHHLLLREPTRSVMTLGGRDEALFWEQWRQVYGFGIGQLYNPHIKSLSNESGMARWSSLEDLRTKLSDAYALPDWGADGGYVPWLFQNALLLPIYLTRGTAPEVGQFSLDSWAAFLAAMDDGLPALDVLARYATGLYLRPTRE